MAAPVPGNARKITITNSGANPALDLAASTTGLPAGTAITSNTCGATLAAGASCEITLTPGATPTATAGNASPTTALLEVAGSNTNTRTVNVSVIVYGSRYQGGWVFDIDDSTANTGSIGGKVLAPTEGSTAIHWGPLTEVGGISETSTAGAASCNGATDGACNTARIVAAQGGSAMAASLCVGSTEGGHSDWYLPAICEMGYGIAACGTSGSPTLYGNVRSRLKDNGDIGSINTGWTWSSTEHSPIPTQYVYANNFMDGPGVRQGAFDKVLTPRARCARALTP